MKRAVFLVGILFSLAFLLLGCGKSAGVDSSLQETEHVEESQQQTQEEVKEAQINAVDSLKLTMGGASPGGFWSLLGNGIGSIIQENVAQTQYSYETGNGVKNIFDVASGNLELGIAFNFEIKAGLNGDEPFREIVPEVMGLVSLYDNSPVQVIISKNFADKYGIASMEDIATKRPPIRLGVNQRGNLSETVNRVILEAYGITYEDIVSWGGEVYYEPYKPSADMMKDNKVDWIGVPVFAPDGKFLELATSRDIMLLSINEDAQALLQEKMGIPPGVIKAGTYEWQSEDIATSDAGAILIADPNLPMDVAYTVTKIMVENIEKYKALHVNLSDMTPEKMADVSPATLHPGAEAYFKEIGILK